MSLTDAYDPNNIFAKIIAGDIPCAKVHEDEAVLSFMDAFPQSRGHTLVIPKGVSSVNLLDLDPQALTAVMARTQMIARAVVAALSPDGFRIMQFNGAPAGQSVFHTHFHIIPSYEGQVPAPHGGGQASLEELEATAAMIRAEM